MFVRATDGDHVRPRGRHTGAVVGFMDNVRAIIQSP